MKIYYNAWIYIHSISDDNVRAHKEESEQSRATDVKGLFSATMRLFLPTLSVAEEHLKTIYSALDK